jgi:hypothetical protein
MGTYQPGNRPKSPTQLPLFPLHTQSVCSTPFMVISAQMQHAVDQQCRQLFLQRPAGSLSLALSRRQGNHDVPEMGSHLVEAVRRSRLTKRKRQHIGASVLLPEPVIEPSHPPVTYE